jgi:hypothetical protein
MTHIGARKVRMRVFDNNSFVGEAQMRLEWRPLGSSYWTKNAIVEAPLVGNWSQVDFGICRPEIAVLGSQQWEWRIVAAAPDGSGVLPRLDCVFIESTEQHLVASAPAAVQVPDHSTSKAPQTAEDNAGIGTVAWVNPGNAKASDNAYATATFPEPGGAAESHYLLLKKFAFAIPAEAEVTGVTVSVERHGTTGGSASTVADNYIKLVKGGVIGGKTKGLAYTWPSADTVQLYGGSTDLWGNTLTPADVNAEGFGVAISARIGTEAKKTPAAFIDAITITVYYTETKDENRVCFATRSTEMRSDGMFRQAPEEDVWARVTPNGFLPYAPQSGLEARAARGMLVPSFGDFDTLNDAGTHKLAVQIFYYPGYHFASESK